MRALLDAFEAEQAVIRQGGGAKAIESQHKKKRLTARERLELLLDPGTEFHELGIYAAHGMYTEYGGAPAAGTGRRPRGPAAGSWLILPGYGAGRTFTAPDRGR